MSQAGSVLDHPVAAGVRAAAAGLDPSGPAAVWQLSDDDVETTLATLLEVEARTVALQAALLREAEARDLTARTRAATVERWLGDRFRLSRADAAARARDAVLLGRHPMVHAALADGRVTVEQAGVTATVLDRVALLPEVSADERQEAARFLLDQGAALTPRDLARAGQAVLEALTATPSLDDPAEEAALAREQQRAEAEAQHAERDDLRIGRRRGRLRAVLDLGPIGEATVLAWLRTADRLHPGSDGFEDTRPLSERRADTLVDLLAHAAATQQPADTDAESGDDWCPTGPDGAGSGGLDVEKPRRLPGEPDPGELGVISPVALITVTTTLSELRAGLAGAGLLDTGACLSAAALRHLACDALVVPSVLGTASQVLDLGRSTRDWTWPNAAPPRCATVGVSPRAATGRPPPARSTTAGTGSTAARPTSTMLPCSAGSITAWSTARAGPSSSPTTAGPSSFLRHPSTRSSGPGNITATGSPASPCSPRGGGREVRRRSRNRRAGVARQAKPAFPRADPGHRQA